VIPIAVEVERIAESCGNRKRHGRGTPGGSAAQHAVAIRAGQIHGQVAPAIVQPPVADRPHRNRSAGDLDRAHVTVIVEAGDQAGPGGWDILGTRLKTVFSNNIRNNFGFLNNAAPEGIGKPDKLFVQQGRKVFKEVVPMVAL
jgi:hypothetical protein